MEEFIAPLTVSYTDRHRNPKKHTLYISTTEENAPTGEGFNISPDAQLGTIKYLTLNHCSVDSGAVVLSGKHRDSSFDSGTYIDGNVDTVGVSFQPSHEGRIHIEGDITVVGRNICGDFTLKVTTSGETKISFGQPRPLYFVNKGDGDLLYHLPSLLAVEGEDYEAGIVYPYTTDLKKGDAQKKLSALEKNTENLSQSGVTVQTFCIAPKIHNSDSCRCGMYYPLLLLRHPLAITYFIKAVDGLEKCVPEAYSNITWAQLTQMLNDVNERNDYLIDKIADELGVNIGEDSLSAMLCETLKRDYGLHDLTLLFGELKPAMKADITRALTIDSDRGVYFMHSVANSDKLYKRSYRKILEGEVF